VSVTIHIPTPLRRFTADQGEVQVEGATVGEAMQDLTRRHPSLQRHLFTDDGALRSFVNLFLNDEDVRHLDKEGTRVSSGDTLSIIPSIAGGVSAPLETAARGTVEELPDLSPAEIRHYSRHLILPEVGTLGQKKLKAAKVLTIGAGGLGSPLGLYLAAAGVGTLGMVDFDVVDESNLHRQVLFGRSSVGRPKIQAATERLRDINPHITIVPHETRLDSSNALDLFRDYDIVVDGTDNFPTRYLVNDACVLLGKPNVYGSIFRFDGQASVFFPPHGPCYRCLYPEPPPPGLVPSCAEGGVLGILPGLVGVIQATEVIKLILGKGEPLIGRLLLIDALDMKFRELKLRKNPDCPVCGTHPTIKELIDYNEFCGIRGEEKPVEALAEDIQVEELKRRLDAGENLFVLDVREPHEYQICNIGGHLISLGDLPKRVNELDSSREIVAHCRSGVRSAKAVDFLRQAGFKKVHNLAGGILAWADRVDPKMPKY
jgi:sulfur-carrier protein adenylyltransferase/sulfurtransferase